MKHQRAGPTRATHRRRPPRRVGFGGTQRGAQRGEPCPTRGRQRQGRASRPAHDKHRGPSIGGSQSRGGTVARWKFPPSSRPLLGPAIDFDKIVRRRRTSMIGALFFLHKMRLPSWRPTRQRTRSHSSQRPTADPSAASESSPFQHPRAARWCPPSTASGRCYEGQRYLRPGGMGADMRRG